MLIKYRSLCSLNVTLWKAYRSGFIFKPQRDFDEACSLGRINYTCKSHETGVWLEERYFIKKIDLKLVFHMLSLFMGSLTEH